LIDLFLKQPALLEFRRQEPAQQEEDRWYRS
jgi:hypothetical protein